MKTFNDLADFIEKKANSIDKLVIKANDIVAKKVYNDILQNAPTGATNSYRESIRIYPTEVKNNVISTFIGSDLCVGPTKWTGSKMYNLGYLLEHGTTEHAIPNAFDYGFYYGFTDMHGRYHKGTLDKDWHPGTIAQPHYAIALEKNKKFYKDNIRLAWREK